MKKDNFWKIHKNPRETGKLAEDLEAAVNYKNSLAVASLLSVPGNVRSLIVRRGQNNYFLDLPLTAFLFLLAQKFGNKKIEEINSDDFKKFLRIFSLPEMVVAEILAIAFHLRDRKIFEGLLNLITRSKDFFQDAEALAYILNIYGSWLGSVEGDHIKNVEVNKQALTLARKNNLAVMECKSIFALSDHKAFRDEKELKPKNQIEDFKKLSKRFFDLGVDHDSLRCDIELAFAHLMLAKKQSCEDRDKNLEKALSVAKKAQEKARKMEYPNAFIRVKIILRDIYMEMENETQTIRYSKEIEKLKAKHF